MAALEILDSPHRAGVLLDETRLRLVRELGQPDSAAGVARRLGLPRQRVNYHLRELEKAGFVELVEERRKGNCTERVVRASADAYLIGPDAVGPLCPDPAAIGDRLSPTYLIAVAARAIRDLARLARPSSKPVSTITLEADIRFASAADRIAFAEDLAKEIATLVREYHDEASTDVHAYRLILGAYPANANNEKVPNLQSDDAG